MSAEADKVDDDEKPSELTMDTEVLRKTCNYALIKVRATPCHAAQPRAARERARAGASGRAAPGLSLIHI